MFLLPVLFLLGNSRALAQSSTSEKDNELTAEVCPPETDLNHTIINSFITSPDWEKGRKETNTNQLTEPQITLLESPEYTSTCKALNEKFQEVFTKKWPDGSLKSALTYYKVGNFFFVIETPNQSDASDAFIVGHSFIYIFDANLNYITGYYFE